MSKARDLADFVSAGSPLADGTISVSEVSGAAPTASPTFTGNATFDTDTFYVNGTSDYVGIGTTSQLAAGSRVSVQADSDYAPAITVSSNASATNWARIDFKNTNASDTGIIYQDQSGNFSIRNDGASPITFFTNGANERMRIGTSGELGIGGANYGTAGQVLTSGGSGAAPSWQSVSFTTNVITGNTTATANNHYYLNGSAITLTLPASPSVGDEVRISEVAGNTDCVIGRNGSNIMSSGTDLTIDTGYTVIYLRYVDATIGWAFS